MGCKLEQAKRTVMTSLFIFTFHKNTRRLEDQNPNRILTLDMNEGQKTEGQKALTKLPTAVTETTIQTPCTHTIKITVNKARRGGAADQGRD